MVTFTDENITWLKALLDQAKGKAAVKGQAEKVRKIEELYEKVGNLIVGDIQTTITEEKVDRVNHVLKELEYLVSTYTKITDLGDLFQYDRIKKEMTARLEFLMTCKDEFATQASYLEDYLKKEYRTMILHDISENRKDENGKSTSISQADKLVEIDARYLAVKKEIQKVSQLSDRIKTTYDFYMKMWQGVFQSVSTASKERFAGSNNDSV